MSRFDRFRPSRLDGNRFGVSGLRGGGLGAPTPSIITATIPPSLGALMDGDQVQDGLSAGALLTSNYASTASTISTVVAAVTINGSPEALTDVVSAADVAAVTITVTDGAANERAFSAGSQTVAGVVLTGIGAMAIGSTFEVAA